MDFIEKIAEQILTGAGIAGFVLFLVVCGLAYFITLLRRENSDTRSELKECWTNYSALLKDQTALAERLISILNELKSDLNRNVK